MTVQFARRPCVDAVADVSAAQRQAAKKTRSSAATADDNRETTDADMKVMTKKKVDGAAAVAEATQNEVVKKQVLRICMLNWQNSSWLPAESLFRTACSWDSSEVHNFFATPFEVVHSASGIVQRCAHVYADGARCRDQVG